MILSCGEALIDLIPRTGPDGIVLRALPGGGPLNVAVAARRLGAPAGFLGRVSHGVLGAALREVLRREDVDTRFTLAGERPTTLALVQADASGRNRYDLYTHGTSELDVRPEDLPADLGPVAALHVGTLALAVEPFATTVMALVEREAAERVVSLDPNVRPAAVTAPALFRARVERAVEVSAVVKASEDDLAWLYPATTPDDAAARWAASGPELVVLSRGARGALGIGRACRVEVEAPRVAVADTVGAGDTLVAGLLTWLHENGALSRDRLAGLDAHALRACLGFACAAAAVTCSRVGADPPRRAEVPCT